MDGFSGPDRVSWPQLRLVEIGAKTRRWQAHAAHALAAPATRPQPALGTGARGVQGNARFIAIVAWRRKTGRA